MNSGPNTCERVTLTIDGRKVQAAAGVYVLQAAREAGIEIPTLCDHPALEPMGACRLCLVEVGHPDWKGWTGLMTACLYPVAEGIEVQTDSAKVREARRQVLTLLAARCPNSPEILELARRSGVDSHALRSDPNSDRCILCGLCTRVCEAYATSAIATVGRGTDKAIGAFAGAVPEECVGCGACADICPTGNIAAQRTASDYRIWGRVFATSPAVVTQVRCVGCGSCEEACPFSVARVALQAGGRRVAIIPTEHCRGCGACVGVCPGGAIDQQTYGWEALLNPCAAQQGGQP
jgi:bidirectional [NiFe] hydrogenase diaphorase subunit